jgi:hypothetical protein
MIQAAIADRTLLCGSMRLTPLAKTLHRAKSRTGASQNHQGQPTLPAQTPSGSWPLPSIQAMHSRLSGVNVDLELT